MDTNDAAATGALTDEVNAADLRQDETMTTDPKHRAIIEDDIRVPCGATDPMWYLAANELVPHMARTKMRAWIEGFVKALEAARGIDGEPGVGDVLRNSLGMDVEVPVAVREPRPHKADEESLAKFLFDRQATIEEIEDDELAAAWEDPGVREFWLSEARAILRFLP